MSQSHTLTFVRFAVRSKDGRPGRVYRHEWSTGHQLLIFQTHEKAEEFAASLNSKIEDEDKDADLLEAHLTMKLSGLI